jgi:AraC-like DNA-binding protein
MALWARLVDYAERIEGELHRREPAPAGVPLILAWSGTVALPGEGAFRAGFVAGPTDRFGDTVCSGESAGIQVDLTWLGARAVLGMPLVELRHRAVAVADVWGADGRRLMERLAETPTAADRRRLVETFLLVRAESGAAALPDVVTHTAALIERHGGRIGVTALADELGYGRQHLHREVTRHLGLPPRTLARLIRFRSVLAAARAAPAVPAGPGPGSGPGATGPARPAAPAGPVGPVGPAGRAGLAADYGYYDQAHLYREFRDLAGMTPREARTAWQP